MRFGRLLLVGSLILAPALASAQEKRGFENSWFWGVKGGAQWLHTEIAKTTAPEIGADWLITRNKFALNVALDQSYFDAISTVNNAGNAAANGVRRRVEIRDMRRLTFAVNAYPWVIAHSIRPYGGLGYSLNFVVRANSEGNDFASPEAKDTVLTRIQEAKTRGSMVGVLGIQGDWWRIQPFLQATVMPTQGRGGRFLINGNGFTYIGELGVRFNWGTSIDKLR